MSLPTKTPPIIPFYKNKNKSVRTASEITTIRKFQADSAYYYDNSETQAKDLASIYGSTIYPQGLSQSGMTLDAGRLLQSIETPLQPSSDGSILYSDIITPDAPGYDIMVMAGQSNGVGWTGYATATPTSAAVSDGGASVTFTYNNLEGAFYSGFKAVVAGCTVSGSGFNGTGVVTDTFGGTSSVKIAITSNGSATTSGSRIRFLDFDDQLFFTGTLPTISGLNTVYTYGASVGTLPTVGSTVTVQNLSVASTSFGYTGTGRVMAIDDTAKTITVNILSSGTAPTPLTTGANPSRIVVISTYDVASKIFTLVGTNNAVLPAFDPLPQNNHDLFSGTGTPNKRGSLITFASNYANSSNLRSNRRVLLVQTSMASNSFRVLDNTGTGFWQSTSPFVGGAAYTNCVDRIQSAMTQTFSTSLPRDNRIVAVCWQDGEGDAQRAQSTGETSATTSAIYKADLLNFVSNLRSLVASVSTDTLGLTSSESSVMANTFSFLVGGVTPGVISSSAGYIGMTSAAQDVGGTTFGGAAVPRSAYVESLTGIPTLDIHFTGTDQKILGDRYTSVFNGVVAAYTGISTVTSATVKRFTYRRVSNLTINWVLTTPSVVTVDIYISGTASSKYGVLVNTGTVSSGTTSVVSAYKPLDNVYYYAIITPKTTTLNGVPFTTSAVLSVPVDDVAPTIVSPSIAIQSQKLVATWSTSKPCSSLVEFFSNSTSSTSGGTIVSRVTVLPNTLTATIPNALVSRSFYYAVVRPAGGSPVTSGTVQQPITPILETRFSTSLSVVGKIDPVTGSTITGSINGRVMTVTAGVARIGQMLASGITTTLGSRPVYIVSAQAPVGTYRVVLSESITTLASQSITLTGCGLLTVTSGTPVAGALLTSGASVGDTRIVGPTPDPNVWVVSQSQTVAAGTTFLFSGPVDRSINNKQFKLVYAEHSSNPISFPTDPIMNSVVYTSTSALTEGVSPFIGILGGFPGGSFTKMVWVNMLTLSDANQNLIGTINSPLYIPGDGLIKSVVSKISLIDGSTASNNRLVSGIWTHIAAVYDASTNQGSIYINGIKDTATVYTFKELTNLSGSKPYEGTDNVKYSYANLSIGGFNGLTGQFSGSMDDIRIYPIALTDAEILSVYNSKPTVTNLQTTATTANSVTLSWTAPSGVTVTEYRIQQSTDEGVTWGDSSPSTSTSTSVTVTGLGSLANSRIALKVAPVVGGIVGKSEIINTATLGNPVFRLVGGNGSTVLDTVSGRTLTLVNSATLNVNTSGLNTVFGIAGTTRNVMTIPDTGYITISGNMPAGSHSFCCWMKATVAQVLFEYAPGGLGSGATPDPHHIIWFSTADIFGIGSAIVSLNPRSQTHKAKTLRVIAGGVIECDAAHGLADNDPIRFEKSYFAPSGDVIPTTSINTDTTYFVRLVSPTSFALRVSASGADITPVTPVGTFVAGVYSQNSVQTSNTWVHVTSVYDQINGTSSIYLTTTVAGVAPKSLVPRVFRINNNRVVFPAATRGAVDLFQIARYSNNAFGQFTGVIDDFRAYAKVLSPSEIAAIVAGTA
jgi:hypothetical protein